MSTTDTNRALVHQLIEGVTSGRLLETFDALYADDVVMSENGAEDPARQGKAANRAYEQYFVEHSAWNGVKVGPVLADGDTTAYEIFMDFTIDGQRVARTQWAVQTWKDGRIAREVFHYAA
jgi:hypothetical protein